MPSRTPSSGTVEREIVRLLRSYILSWLCITSSVTNVAFMTLATPGGLLADHSVWVRLAAHVWTVFVYLGFSYFALPRAFVAAHTRGWPLLWVQSASYVVPAALTTILFAILDHVAIGSAEFWWYALIVLMVTVISVFVGLMAFWVFATPRAGIDMNPNRIWWFTESEACGLQPHLRPEARGRVLRLTAENQYVRVETEKGEDLIRMGLTEAIELVPDNQGMRIHRSHWIAHDQAVDLKFEGGNPRVRLADGTKLPVSRRSVNALRRILT